jgi:hypothetical protein
LWLLFIESNTNQLIFLQTFQRLFLDIQEKSRK